MLIKMIYHKEDLAFRVVSIGTVLHKKGTFSVKARPFAAFALRIKGSAAFRIGERQFSSFPGDITFIPDGVAYEAEYTDGESIVLHFSDCNYHVCENIGKTATPYVKERFEDMEKAWEQSKINEIKSIFYHLLSLLAESEKKETDDAFTACLSFMKTHFSDPSLSLAAVARAGFISEATLRRKCMKHLALSPKEYIIKLRLSHGISLLHGGASVREAAKACGFSDEKFFSRTVKAHFGIPPSAFGIG